MRILLTGASGFIGSHLGTALNKHHEILGITHRSQRTLPFPAKSLDLRLTLQLSQIIKSFKPQVIVHSAALSRVLACEQNPQDAIELNEVLTSSLAVHADSINAKLIFLSSDQVYSGEKGSYIESDSAKPINVYGKTKLNAEQTTLDINGKNAVIRCNSVVGPSIGWGESFSDWILNKYKTANEKISLFEDQYRSPIHIRSMVEVLRAFCENSDYVGLLNVGGLQRLNRVDLGYMLCRQYGFDPDRIETVSYLSHPQSYIMPRDGSYNISRLKQLLPQVAIKPLEEEFATDAETAVAHEV